MIGTIKKLFPDRSIGKKLQSFSKKRIKNFKQNPNFDSSIEIIIPCYNHAEFLRAAFDSAAGQTWRESPITITFIDDNSTDDTAEIIRNIIKANQLKHVRIKSLKNETNLRQWGSLNRAISESSNDLMVILNDDDMLVKDSLEKIIWGFNKNPKLALVGGSSIWFDEDGIPAHEIKSPILLDLKQYSPEGSYGYTELNDLNMTHSSSAFFKDAWSDVGGYFPKNKRIHPLANEDRDFQMRINSLYPVGVFTEYPLAYWRTDTSHGKDY
jgi:glycosyltransferase involved in cell wall biosynthesis